LIETQITIKQLLEVGAHFGHQTKRWNPKMKPYIFSAKNGIYIIDLQTTVNLFREALNFLVETVAQGESILFVGTKRQSQEAIEEEAKRCNMFYVNQRWLGGTLTNFSTIRKNVDRLEKLEKMKQDGTFDTFIKKEALHLERELNKLEKKLGGIKGMNKLPGGLFIVDPKKENLSCAEARKLGIPTVSLCDTNCDPDDVDYVISGNDDAIRAIRLITSKVADACIEGQKKHQERIQGEKEEKEIKEAIKEKKVDEIAEIN
jgi:small subunit ribosomal protein S2